MTDGCVIQMVLWSFSEFQDNNYINWAISGNIEALWCPSCINSVAGQLTLCKHRNRTFPSETTANKWIFLRCKAYRGTDRTYFATGHVASKLYCKTDFVLCSSKTTHDSNLLFWELQGRQSLIRDNARFGKIKSQIHNQNFNSSLLIVISFQFHKSVTLLLSVSWNINTFL